MVKKPVHMLLNTMMIATVFSLAEATYSKKSNVVYGMYSGLALLMDVYKPETSNGYGILWINGSGWHTGTGMNTVGLKDRMGAIEALGLPLVEEGFTLFTINHRAAPRFKIPEIVSDVQRAVRFVRHQADNYQINPNKLTAIGTSSGGHLVSLLGVLDGQGDPDANDEVLRESAKVQCVVAHAAPSDIAAEDTPRFFVTTITAAMGIHLPRSKDEIQFYQQFSPIYHVTSDDASIMLIHGDNDEVVPFSQAENFTARLKETGVPVTFVPVAGGGHGMTSTINNASKGKLPHPKSIAIWIREQLN